MLYNQEIEQALLGAMLVSDNAYDDAAHLRQEYFYVPVHGRIFDHIKIMREQGKTPTAHLIGQFFSHDADLIEAGGAEYISALANNVMSTRNAKSYADAVYSAHLRRMLKSLGSDLSELAENPEIGTAPMEIIGRAESLINDASDTGSAETLRHIGVNLDEAMKDADFPRMGVRSGLSHLDTLLNGYQPGKLYVIAARPAMGKTAMGLTHAVNPAMSGIKTLFFSLEMTHAEIQKRLILRYGTNSDNLKNAQLYIDDKAGLTVSEISQRARRHKRKNGIDIIFIDYLGLIRATDSRAQMVHQIGEITSRLKGLAKDLGVPVVLLCQLNRGVEGRDNKRPAMADLRDSGAIEQDADVVMFIYREEYYLANGKPETTKYKKDDTDYLASLENSRGKAELIVSKNRHGKLGTIHLNWNAERQVFSD